MVDGPGAISLTTPDPPTEQREFILRSYASTNAQTKYECTKAHARTHKQSANAVNTQTKCEHKSVSPWRSSRPLACGIATTETHANTDATNAVHTQTDRSLLLRSPRIFERAPCGPFLMKGSVFSQFGF